MTKDDSYHHILLTYMRTWYVRSYLHRVSCRLAKAKLTGPRHLDRVGPNKKAVKCHSDEIPESFPLQNSKALKICNLSARQSEGVTSRQKKPDGNSISTIFLRIK